METSFKSLLGCLKNLSTIELENQDADPCFLGLLRAMPKTQKPRLRL